MNRLLRKTHANECGSVAIEFAVLLPSILIPLLAATLFFGRFFWHYTVAEKAAHDAARFVAAASPTELKTLCTISIYKDSCVVMAGITLATKELAELKPSEDDGNSPRVWVYCDDGACTTDSTSSAPKTVSVAIRMTVDDPFLNVFTSVFTGSGGPLAIPISVSARISYVGN
jgi:Flp pilus assembly protein TadG